MTTFKLPGCADYLNSATGAGSAREALFFVESAELLQAEHARTPFDRLLTDSRAIVAVRGRHAVLLARLDFVRSTTESREAMQEIAARAKSELAATSLELRLTGRATELAGRDAATAGWEVVQSIPRG